VEWAKVIKELDELKAVGVAPAASGEDLPKSAARPNL
jgi:hypothetical protein